MLYLAIINSNDSDFDCNHPIGCGVKTIYIEATNQPDAMLELTRTLADPSYAQNLCDVLEFDSLIVDLIEVGEKWSVNVPSLRKCLAKNKARMAKNAKEASERAELARLKKKYESAQTRP